ncbi:MAG: TRAP transporter large permease [Chelatococcus sp.]|jgi:tripartite ATP-independent transporter DctM subunit|uniref:TRAP transporter large permease n=1 Tax=unclassified Chelatococcus TaxID=2638111 RepID=UPI001BCD205A|nr:MULTISPECIES: TRAP transporter large permease [unclassified Chelatococcus]CAH1671805.1 Tripartite ATP-independent transporter DctM subunit [Hyphomicrobiales bacterium]MBS7738510.1 TRAP transporter large permease [Chelatococcus sp. HY11]MBX3536138.1 TRAP transporter large permease [Chelatococcus sp.]MBX3542914.1 TRAP transporter large permease [Chelatococcus sp.]MCO5076960.1 TRAP transporter large permease [Chelatococcus sp.]
MSALSPWLPSILMFVLFALRTPITWAMAIPALLFFIINRNDVPLSTFAQEMAEGTQSISLLALPFFVLAGAIMNAAGITRRLLNVAEILVGHMTGALAQMCIVLATLLGGLTASSNADAAILSKTIGLQMAERNYSRAFAAVVTSSSSIIASLLPPSIGLIIYGYLTETSIGRLFAAGIVPGLMMCAGMMITTYFVAKRRGYAAQRTSRATLPEVKQALLDGLWALSVPFVILFGTRYGIFTTTESGAVVVVYVLLIGLIVYRAFSWRQLPSIIQEAVLDTSAVMIMICAASALGFYLAWEQVPQKMASGLASYEWSPLGLLLTINVLLIIIGTAIEGSSALIILTPMLLPLIQKAGVDPVQFGIVMVANLTIAGVTPPVGGMMYIASRVLRVPMKDYAIEVSPYLLMMMVLLVILSAFPGLSLWLPNFFYN